MSVDSFREEYGAVWAIKKQLGSSNMDTPHPHLQPRAGTGKCLSITVITELV